MQTIWKYALTTTDNQTISMPRDGQILAVQTQSNEPCLWVMVNPEAPKEDRYIETFGTGHPIRGDMGLSREYIGTYQLHGGELVFHVFEAKD